MTEALHLGALNHLLGQSEWARRRMMPFAGRQARFEMPPWRFAFRITADGLFEAVDDEAVDVTVALPPDAPFLALQGFDRAMAGAHVTGNAEFATVLSFVLKNLRWDAEEDLSKLVGDVAARRIVRTATALTAWQRQAARNLAENVAEYLREESGLATPVRDLLAFRSEVAEFSRRLDQLEVRARALS